MYPTQLKKGSSSVAELPFLSYSSFMVFSHNTVSEAAFGHADTQRSYAGQGLPLAGWPRGAAELPHTEVQKNAEKARTGTHALSRLPRNGCFFDGAAFHTEAAAGIHGTQQDRHHHGGLCAGV